MGHLKQKNRLTAVAYRLWSFPLFAGREVEEGLMWQRMLAKKRGCPLNVPFCELTGMSGEAVEVKHEIYIYQTKAPTDIFATHSLDASTSKKSVLCGRLFGRSPYDPSINLFKKGKMLPYVWVTVCMSSLERRTGRRTGRR